MTAKHILLVEDDLRDSDLTLAALEDYSVGNEIFVVRDGQEALDYLYFRGKYKSRERRHPVVVLLDNKMPKLSGLDVLKAVKSDEHLKTIPVVVLSSSSDTPDLIEFYRHGVNAYVVKPTVFSEFMTKVKQLGEFWAVINEPPPFVAPLEAAISNATPHPKRSPR
ncbi:MAG TPA: response regulator [Verrucomicrobiae bacterium]|jgi:CheY-like chemotaxis protein|nr:response regulator [Verrucomicrobiae bacterium]